MVVKINTKRVMTELEQHIYDTAMGLMPDIKAKIKRMDVKGTVMIPFICYGVIDHIVYDADKKCFTHIEYSKGIREGMNMPFNNYSAYFNPEDIVTKRIEIKKKYNQKLKEL